MVTGNVAALELVRKANNWAGAIALKKFYWIYFAKSITR
jgi:hypothetical protein